MSVDVLSLKIAIIGMGYVGLPVAMAMARAGLDISGFDINAQRISELKRGLDKTGEIKNDSFHGKTPVFTNEIKDIANCNVYIVCVPTPIDSNRQPDLTPVQKATSMIGGVLKKNDIVIYESTVYPGVTEEICGPILKNVSGLKQGRDFKLGYSPERINPGDNKHTIETIVKVVSGEDEQTLEIVAKIYGSIVRAGVHKAQSIKVAEAAKVIENIQRDLNIALMNELSIIFDKLDIRTADVLEASRTKWNFMPFSPGLVGGHCIGVDPYYLTARAEQVGYSPQVILSGRRINDGMGSYIAQKIVRLLNKNDLKIKGARVGILGMTFKENVSDIRNSRVPDIILELAEFGITPILHDPLADVQEIEDEYGLIVSNDLDAMKNLDALVLAVPHKTYLEMGGKNLSSMLNQSGIFIDVKSAILRSDVTVKSYWSL